MVLLHSVMRSLSALRVAAFGWVMMSADEVANKAALSSSVSFNANHMTINYEGLLVDGGKSLIQRYTTPDAVCCARPPRKSLVKQTCSGITRLFRSQWQEHSC